MRAIAIRATYLAAAMVAGDLAERHRRRRFTTVRAKSGRWMVVELIRR